MNGHRYQAAILVGCQEIIAHEKELNRLNVFPIPDKDTGSNLKKTLSPLVDKLPLSLSSNLNKVNTEIVSTAVSSALGYSGLIFSQFLAGLAEGLQNEEYILTKSFVRAAERAVARAYETIKHPQEGTILTVYKDWLSEIQWLSEKTDDFVLLLQDSLNAAKSSLDKTPQLLDILKKHRVVDAGGKAFIYFLDGILRFIEKGNLRELMAKNKMTAFTETVRDVNTRLHYCVECCVRKENLHRMDLVNALKTAGANIIFYGSKDFAKIRIDTDDTENLIRSIAEFGDISAQQVFFNQKDLPRQRKKSIAFVSDTTCDLPDEYIENNDIYFVPIKIQAADRIYTDKLDIIQEDFYTIMASSPTLPKTSQPGLPDFIRLYENLLTHYQSIISVQLSGELSGTYQTALQAAQSVDPQNIAVIDSKNLSVGLGLVMIEGVKAYNRNLSKEAVLNSIDCAIENTDIFVGIPTLKYLIKGGRVTKAKGLIAKAFNINPIIAVNKKGRLETIGKTIGRRKLEKKILTLTLKKLADAKIHDADKIWWGSQNDKPHPALAVVHSNASELANRVANKIFQHTGQKVEMVMNASPVLGAHAGPGAVAVSILKKAI